MSLSKIITCVCLLASSSFCCAGLSYVSPISLANIEAEEIAKLKVQSGCARPDLSDSSVDGTAVIEISFDQIGNLLEAHIVNSNGSDSDNAKILEAFTKRCKYARGEAKLPKGVVKQFTYTWKAHGDYSGLASCRLMNVEYPFESRRRGEQGKATVAYRYLSADSYESKISQSTGFPKLDEATLRTINLCLNNRALKGDPDASKWSEVSMKWTMKDNEQASSSTQQNSASSSTPGN